MFICCFLIVLTTVGACSSKTEEDSNVQSIKTVLKEALTAPNEQLVTALLYPIEKLQSDEEVTESTILKSENDLDTLLKDTYEDYFTEYGYEKFTIQTSIPISYSLYADGAGYQIVVKNVEVTKDKENPNRYSFKATLEYTTDEDETKTVVATGRVEFEDGKIASLDINDDGDLLEKMSTEAIIVEP
ncbi:MAG: hypothetical protein ABS916_00155 [Carnobacterium sp.]|uniref:hypothetical protein n=1 Tax=Carnobacterium sp. TaxID=48221 RepID=UPI003315D549